MKKNQRDFSIYVIMLLVFGLLIFIGLKNGASLHPSTDVLHSQTSSFVLFLHTMKENLGTSLMVLLIQIIIILFACRLFSFLFNKMGQPSVIGEIMAGIILGPSFFGYFFPDTFNLVFSKDSLVYIKLLSHIGLILFMFVIGLEVDFKVLKNKINETLVISHAGILAPFLLGIVASFFVYKEYASEYTGFVPFALFIGISMSITAFPVLARIVQEKGFMDTPLGALTIASAANDDVTAWCLLAVVIAIAKAGTVISSLYAVVCTFLYILFMFLAVRPFFKKIGTYYINRETVNKNFISFAFLTLILSAAFTQLIGIHALFGAFIAGVVMPSESNFRRIMIDKIEDVTLVFFLPLFFAYTGLNTNVLLINNWSMVFVCVLFIAFAILGKFGGCAVSAKLVGESWHDSLIIGTLMNTRGLMELVALNIGYEMGILSKSIFAILVIMALVTTFMTTPALNLITRFYSKEKQMPQKKLEKLMFSFSDSYSSLNFLSIIQLIFGRGLYKKKIIASHFIQDADLNMITAEHYFQHSFAPLMTESQKRQIPITKCYKLTENITNEIVSTVKEEGVDYLFIGSASGRIGKQKGYQGKKINLFRWSLRHIEEKSLSLSGIVITDKTREILNRVNCMVFVVVGMHRMDSILNVSIIIDNEQDIQLLDYVENILPLVRSLHIYLSASLTNLEKVNKIDQMLLANPQKVSIQQYPELTGLKIEKYKKHLILSSSTTYKSVLKLYEKMKRQSICLFVRYRREETEDKDK